MKQTMLAVMAAIVVVGQVRAEGPAVHAGKANVVILTGSNNHDWKTTTPALAKILKESGRFNVDVVTEPEELTRERLATCDVLLSNWNAFGKGKSGPWSEALKAAYVDFVRNGGGHVVVHAGSSSHYDWADYQAIGGATWKGGTGHRKVHEFEVRIADGEHPVTRGLAGFKTTDELWFRPFVQPGARVLAESFSETTGKWEPTAMVSRFGKGRCFTLLLGHDATTVQSDGFKALLVRGTEWAGSEKAGDPGTSGAGPGPGRPNFVLIIGDDISADDFGCYGHPHIRTPNIDRLAAGGMRFTNAYLTTSQCSPTRCSVITGRYPHNTGAPELHMPLPEGQVMFPAILKQAGYHTAAAGKWHLGEYAKASFDTVIDSGPGGEERWVDCLVNRPKDRPFFMWFASHDAHRGWAPDPDAPPHGPEDAVIPPYLIDTPAVRKDMARYYDEVQRLDRYTGLVVDELKRQGVLENTCLIFMADNGRPFPRCKTRLHDSGIKTPLVIHWPAGTDRAGSVCDSLLSVIDIAPTVLGLAGLKPPPSFQGISMQPLLGDPSASIRDMVFAEHNWHGQIAHERMVRMGDFVYIRNAHPQLPQICGLDSQCPQKELRELAKEGKLTAAQLDPLLEPRPAEELFKLGDDPDQLENLAGQPERREVLGRMRGLVDEWQRRTGDTVPSLQEATPDRYDRRTGKPVLGRGGRPEGGVIPGQTSGATEIDDPGPR